MKMYDIELGQNEKGDILIIQDSPLEELPPTIVISLDQVEILCKWLRAKKREIGQ